MAPLHTSASDTGLMATEYDYVIVGAGPAGLQMAYFLQKAGRSYIVFEAAEKAGSFFAQFPRHGKMISINKKYNLFDEERFNLRHDWNSLLSDDPELKFTNFSDELYPNNKDVHNYLNLFAERFQLNIKYNTTVSKISKEADVFTVETAKGSSVTSRCVLMATGPVEENLPEDIEGIELAETYGTHSLDQEQYINKQVLIIGGGNSAFEAANHIAGHAGVVHVTRNGRIKFAWNTHYVGDLRAVNSMIIDMYHLKSMHSTIGTLVTKITKDDETGKYTVYFKDLNTHIDRPSWLLFQMEYDHVISSCGWKYIKPQIFDKSIKVESNGRYPKLSPIWETDTENLFYIGTAMASIDRKSASGFVHGFRYNIRTLFNLLEERFYGVSLHTLEFDKETLPALAEHVMDSMSIGDSLYQMNGFLCDVILINDSGKAVYYSDIPRDHVMSREEFKNASQLFMLYLAYGFDRFGKTALPVDNVHAPDFSTNRCASFLHPYMEYYEHGEYIDTCELQESLIARFDEKACPKYPQWQYETNLNYVKYYINSKVHWTDEVFNLMPLPLEMIDKVLIPLTEEEMARIPPLWEPVECKPSQDLLPANPKPVRTRVLVPSPKEMFQSIGMEGPPPMTVKIEEPQNGSQESLPSTIDSLPSSPGLKQTDCTLRKQVSTLKRRNSMGDVVTW